MVEIIRERNPQFMDELKRDFVPYEVMEGDFSYRGVTPDGRMSLLHRRQRKVRYVSHDQNSLRETVDDLGPATGEDAVVIPCDGAVEIAQAIELIAWHKRVAEVLKRRRAEVEPERTKYFLDQMELLNDEARRAQKGMTTVGPYARVQREGATR